MEDIHLHIKEKIKINLFIMLVMGQEEIIILHQIKVEALMFSDGEIRQSLNLKAHSGQARSY
jgi:hypothetical protein